MQPEPLIHCVFSTDSDYCPHLATALASLLDSNRANALFLHIVHQDVGAENLAKLETVLGAGHAGWAFYNFGAREYGHLYTSGHISLASYFRLFLTDILPHHIDRIIYIDADVIVREDIAPLAALQMTGPIAAAPDPFTSGSNERLGLPSTYLYFNAGVLVMDLAKWRAGGIRDRLLDFVEDRGSQLKFHDQDALNALLHEEVDYLDLRWNFPARAKLKHLTFLGLGSSEYKVLSAQPAIVHFTSFRKPWLYKYDVPFEAEYLYYRERTPWGGYVQPDRTPVSRLLRAGRRRAPALFKLARAIRWRLRKHRPSKAPRAGLPTARPTAPADA